MIEVEQKAKRVASVVLSHYIVIDREMVKAGDATDEEFGYYVYHLLEQFFEEELKEDEDIAERRYYETFNLLDWAKDEDRVKAIYELNGMNRARRTCGLPVIALFA